MFKKIAILFFVLSCVTVCFASIEYDTYNNLVSYYGNNIDKTPLSLLEEFRNQGVTYQEFFDYLIAFADFNLFYTNMKCNTKRENVECLRLIAKIDIAVEDLPFFAEFHNQPLDTSKFKIWKENALNGKPTFNLSKNGKDWKYITIVLDKVEDINTHAK